MKLILVHGPPATGKMTVSRKLADITGAPLVDNHVAIDLARNVFGFGAPGFWELVHDVRVATLRAAARADVPVLITTAAYNHPGDLVLLRSYEGAVQEFGGSVSYVYLTCSEQTLMKRVVAPERRERGKLSTQDGLKNYLAANNFEPAPRDACLQLSTEISSPLANAQAIALHFGLIGAE